MFAATAPDLCAASRAHCGRSRSRRWWVRNTCWGQGSRSGMRLRRCSHHALILSAGAPASDLEEPWRWARLVSLCTQVDFPSNYRPCFAGVKDIRAGGGAGGVLGSDTGARTVRSYLSTKYTVLTKVSRMPSLPHIEDGTICFVGATTENPSFEVNSALLSRLRVYRLRPVTAEVLEKLLARTVARCYPDIDVGAREPG